MIYRRGAEPFLFVQPRDLRINHGLFADVLFTAAMTGHDNQGFFLTLILTGSLVADGPAPGKTAPLFDGQTLEGVGVTPDVLVEEDWLGYSETEDPFVLAALEALAEEITLDELDEVTEGLGFLTVALLAFAGVAVFVQATPVFEFGPPDVTTGVEFA